MKNMNRNNIKIIIIDDDPGIVDSIKSVIGETYYVEGYTESKEGLKRLKEETFDILILDYYIDELNGCDIVKKIRKYNDNIYILIITGYGEKVPGLKTLEELEIQNYCEKSGDFEKMLLCIQGAIKSVKFFKDKVETTGERIKALRKVHNLSQDDVAKYLDVQRTTISLYESDATMPPTGAIIKLARLFNVTTDYLLCFEFNTR